MAVEVPGMSRVRCADPIVDDYFNYIIIVEDEGVRIYAVNFWVCGILGAD